MNNVFVLVLKYWNIMSSVWSGFSGKFSRHKGNTNCYNCSMIGLSILNQRYIKTVFKAQLRSYYEIREKMYNKSDNNTKEEDM